MSLELLHLDACTRRFMLAELRADLHAGVLYLSPHLNERGRSHYAQLLHAAVATGTERSFADDLSAMDFVELPAHWKRSDPKEVTEALLAAAELLAEREFHRFYIRGLCRRAIHEGVPSLVIYRAKPAQNGRANSEMMVGVKITASSLLEDLSQVFRTMPPHGLPQCRDPGLSVRLP
jgi:hypothetical protein